MPGVVISGERSVAVEVVAEAAARGARLLQERFGVGPGDRVAVLMRNDIDFLAVSGAAALLGAYPVPVNWHFSPAELAYVLEDSGARLLIGHADLIVRLGAGIPQGLPVLAVRTPPELAAAYHVSPEQAEIPPGAGDWHAAIADLAPLPPTERPSPGSMIYTSGTTGKPKGVRRIPTTQADMDESLRPAITAFGLREGMRALIPAPLYHSAPNAFGSLSLRLPIESLVLMPRFDPEELLALIEKHRINVMQMVPTHFVRLLKLPEAVRKRYDVSSLEHIVHAAAPCPPDIKRAMIEWWGPVINEYYGATETGVVVYCSAEEALRKPGTVGRVMPGCELHVFDEDGRDCPPFVPGDVYVRNLTGADFTYHNDPAKRARAGRDHLVSAGDIGYLDHDGFLFLCDRRNDMVISGGVNIYPAEIEAALHNHPGVADCAVFGIPDDEMGEALCAVIARQPGADVDEAALRQYLRGEIAAYKVPKLITFQQDLPREDTGKIFKRKLREPYWEGRERRI